MHRSFQPMLNMLDAREMKMLDTREMEVTSSSMSSKSSMWGEEEVLGFTLFSFPIHSFYPFYLVFKVLVFSLSTHSFYLNFTSILLYLCFYLPS